MRLKPAVLAGLAAHGIQPGTADTPASLRERLNDAYVEDVRRLRDRQRSGEIPLGEYAGRVQELKEGYPLLGLPLAHWTD